MKKKLNKKKEIEIVLSNMTKRIKELESKVKDFKSEIEKFKLVSENQK